MCHFVRILFDCGVAFFSATGLATFHEQICAHVEFPSVSSHFGVTQPLGYFSRSNSVRKTGMAAKQIYRMSRASMRGAEFTVLYDIYHSITPALGTLSRAGGLAGKGTFESRWIGR